MKKSCGRFDCAEEERTDTGHVPYHGERENRTVQLQAGRGGKDVERGDRAADRKKQRGSGRQPYAGQNPRGRNCQGVPSAVDDPVVEPHVEVTAGDLGGSAEDGAAGLGEGEAVPCEDLLVGEGLPALGELFEYGLDGGLRCGARASAVASVADVLAPHGLGGGDPLGGAGHLLECDGRNVLHSL